MESILSEKFNSMEMYPPFYKLKRLHRGQYTVSNRKPKKEK